MPLTAGTVHVLNGTGFKTLVGTPIALRVQLSGVPLGLGTHWSSPPTLIRAGHITPRTAFGATPSIELVHADQLVTGLPTGITSVGYDLVDGEIATVTELVESVIDLSARQPWDRNPATVSVWNYIGLSLNGASNQLWTYTVPANRKLFLAHAELGFHRRGAATTPGLTACHMYFAGNAMLEVERTLATVGSGDHTSLGGGGLVVAPGVVVVVLASDTSATGQVVCWASMQGYTFDA